MTMTFAFPCSHVLSCWVSKENKSCCVSVKKKVTKAMDEEYIAFWGIKYPAHDRYESPIMPYLVKMPWKGLRVGFLQLCQEFL